MSYNKIHHSSSYWLLETFLILVGLIILFFPLKLVSKTAIGIPYSAPDYRSTNQVQSQRQEMTIRQSESLERARMEGSEVGGPSGINSTSRYYKMIRAQKHQDEAEANLREKEARKHVSRSHRIRHPHEKIQPKLNPYPGVGPYQDEDENGEEEDED